VNAPIRHQNKTGQSLAIEWHTMAYLAARTNGAIAPIEVVWTITTPLFVPSAKTACA
jgi:hypothetical protein